MTMPELRLPPNTFKAILLCLCVAAYTLSPVMANDEPEDNSKQLAWNFTLKSQHGKNIKLSELRGQVIAINFWSIQCGTCIQQFPILKAYYQKNRHRGFVILSINIDEDLKKAHLLVRKHQFDYPVLFDPANQASRLYSVDDLPTLYLVDRDGYIRYSLDNEKIKQQAITQQVIEDLLNE
ncbi:MAG TPA: TlpA family protein disulfide reductase [Gammaproteobacteria bacterium]|nr:TlpA family protein disulfide reductase [Gammaproteobacteria bacterium]